MGHPLVTIKTLNKTHISLSQTHFLFDSTSIPPSSSYKYKKTITKIVFLNIIWFLIKTFSYEWYIPFTYSIENSEPQENGLAAKNFNISNIHNRVIWIDPKDKESNVQCTISLVENFWLLWLKIWLKIIVFFKRPFYYLRWPSTVFSINKIEPSGTCPYGSFHRVIL